MVRTLLISRAAASSSELSSSRASNSWWKQARLLSVAEKIAMGGASVWMCWNWCFWPSCSSSLRVSRRLNWSSSSFRGKRPKISSQATSTKFGFLVNCSMGMPR